MTALKDKDKESVQIGPFKITRLHGTGYFIETDEGACVEVPEASLYAAIEDCLREFFSDPDRQGL